MVIQARVIRECAVGVPGECPVQVELVGVTDQELQALENQVEAQGISFLNVRGQEVMEDVSEWGVGEAREASELVAEEASAPEGGLCCSLEPDRAWDDSVCAMVTGLSEQEAMQELAKLELLLEVKRLRDEGVV